MTWSFREIDSIFYTFYNKRCVRAMFSANHRERLIHVTTAATESIKQRLAHTAISDLAHSSKFDGKKRGGKEGGNERRWDGRDLSGASPCFWQLVMIDVARRVFPKSIATNCREGDSHEVAIGNLSIAGNFGSFRAQFPRRCS